VARTSMLLSASGGLNFGTTNPSTTNYCLPTTSYPYPMVLAFWEHLHPSTGGVYTQMFGTAPNRRFVIQWYSVVYSSGTQFIDVRVVLKEGKGDIEMCYVNTISGSTSYDAGYGATAGIQSGTGTGLQFSCNTATLVNGLVLTYTAP
jgi:hypothetical protein